MKSRPILLSSSMVRALLAGTKTQTRRIVKPQPEHLQHHVYKGKALYDAEHRIWWWKQNSFENLIDFEDGRRELAKLCPHGVVGDQLWVRETWSHDASSLDECRAAHEEVTQSVGYGPYYRATEVRRGTGGGSSCRCESTSGVRSSAGGPHDPRRPPRDRRRCCRRACAPNRLRTREATSHVIPILTGRRIGTTVIS